MKEHVAIRKKVMVQLSDESHYSNEQRLCSRDGMCVRSRGLSDQEACLYGKWDILQSPLPIPASTSGIDGECESAMNALEEPGFETAAHGNLLSVMHNHRSIAFGVGADLFHKVKIHHERAMHAQEKPRI